MPVDQHQLLALVAPRALHVASAIDDRSADPRRRFLSAQAADEVWRLYGVRGLGVAECRQFERGWRACATTMHTGGHDTTRGYDWEQYLETVKARTPNAER